MTSTTASEIAARIAVGAVTCNKIRDDFRDAMRYGMSVTGVWIDECRKEDSMKFEDYEIRRFDKKQYSVYLKSGRYEVLKAVYKCSHPEAIRRWTTELIKRRMMR
jgi:hypothetical protein